MKINTYIIAAIVLIVLSTQNVFSAGENQGKNKDKAESSNEETTNLAEIDNENYAKILTSEIEIKTINSFNVYASYSEENINAICATLTFASILGYKVDTFSAVRAFLDVNNEAGLEGYSELEIVQVLDKLQVKVPVNPNTGKSSWKRGTIDKLIQTVAEFGPVIVRLEDVIYSHFIVIVKSETDKFLYFDSASFELKEISFKRMEAYWDKTYLHGRVKAAEELHKKIAEAIEVSRAKNPVPKSSYGYHYFLNPSDDFTDLSLSAYTDFESFDLELMFSYGFGGLAEDSFTELYLGTGLGILDFNNYLLEFHARIGLATEIVLNSDSTLDETKHVGSFALELPEFYINDAATDFADLFVHLGYSIVFHPFENIEWSFISQIGYNSYIRDTYIGVPYLKLSLIFSKFLAIGKYNKQYFEISYRIEPVIIGNPVVESVFQVLSLKYSGGSTTYYSIALELSLDADSDFVVASIFTLGSFS